MISTHRNGRPSSNTLLWNWKSCLRVVSWRLLWISRNTALLICCIVTAAMIPRQLAWSIVDPWFVYVRLIHIFDCVWAPWAQFSRQLAQSAQPLLKRFVFFEHFERDEERKEKLVGFEKWHAHIAIKNFSKFLCELFSALFHQSQPFLFWNVSISARQPASFCLSSFLIWPIGRKFVHLTRILVFVIGNGCLCSICRQVIFHVVFERNLEKSSEPTHREVVHGIEHF